MADGDFLDLQNQLAAFMGAEDVGNLPPVEQQRAKKIINQSYRELYSPMDGFRPAWAVRAIALSSPGLLEVTAVVTEGSTSFTYTGTDLISDYEGSVCKVGALMNKVAKADSATGEGELLAPAGEDATTISVYVNSLRLPPEVIDVDGHPERAGWGVLSPITGADSEARYRGLVGYDFGRVASSMDSYNFGDPQYFYIDSASMGYEEALTRRLVLYPLPSRPAVIRMRANVLPASLVADADRPKLPADVVDDVLLPVARAKLAMIDPRYNSQNIKFLAADAEMAMKRMRLMNDAQKVRSRRIRIRTGY